MTDPKPTPAARIPCRILTLSDTWIDALAPDPALIRLEDVAAGLRKLRWGAHRAGIHTVAAHAVLCAEMAARRDLSPHLAMLCLHHDDGEFLWGDVPTALKPALGGFRRFERGVWRACLAAFGIVPPDADEAGLVAFFDRQVARAEDAQLRPDREPLPTLRGYPLDPDCIIPPWTPDEAAQLWMSAHKSLRNRL